MAEELPEPKNRKEEFLANIAGMDVELPEPANREEIYLNAIAENGGGGGGGDYTAGDGIDITNNTISVDTSTIQEKLTAGSNVAISAENVISATDTTYSAFTGTDGTAAGTSGLVPAPATTDAGKFLKADGTWDTAGGASFEPTILTKADYNYPTDNPAWIALWKLPTGYYRFGEDGIKVRVHNSMLIPGMYSGTAVYVNASPTLHSQIILLDDYTGNANAVGYCYLVNKNTGDAYRTNNNYADGLNLTCYDGLNNSDARTPLSAHQGKVLNDKIEDRIITGAGAPTTSTVGTVGKLYGDTTNGKLYQCTAVSGSTYTWTELSRKFTMVEYGTTTWQQCVDAIDSNSVVYCKASTSTTDPATGVKMRYAFLAYDGRQSSPKKLEFQYYRSRGTHNAQSPVDSVIVYTINASSTWSWEERPVIATPTAGTNVSISYDNNAMTISATDTTYSAFTGTDGQTAGAAGLVPAPATTDAGKFLKSDGTWDTAGGGGGGDTVYSTVTTSDQTDGGAVYIGTLNANQVENADPTSTDNHWKYLWALPSNSSSIPSSGTINIGGDIYGGRGLSNNTVIGAASIGEDGAAWYSFGNIVIGGGLDYSSRARLADETRTSDSILIGRDNNINGGTGNIGLGSGVIISNNSTQGLVADGDVTIGANSKCYGVHQSVALGSCAAPTRNGEVNVGFSSDFGPGGFNDSQYRVIGGVHDGQELHDAATVAQGNTLSTSAPTTSTEGVLGQLYTDTTNMHTYQCTAIDTTDPSNPSYTWTQRW